MSSANIFVFDDKNVLKSFRSGQRLNILLTKTFVQNPSSKRNYVEADTYYIVDLTFKEQLQCYWFW